MSKIALTLAGLLMGTTSLAFADVGMWQGNPDLARVRLISATDGIPTVGPIRLGLEFEINSGWVTYWKIQGPVGIPLEADWSDSLNVADAVIHYPLPERYTYSLPGLEDEAMESFVYREHLVFPVDITPQDPSQSVIANASLQFTVCGEMCIFTDAVVRIDMFPGAENPTIEAEVIEQFAAQVPPLAAEADNGLALVGHSFDTDSSVLSFQLESSEAMSAPDVFVGSNFGGFTFGKSSAKLSEDGTQALVTIPMMNGSFTGEDPTNSDLYITIADASRGVDLGFVRIGDASTFMDRLQPGEFQVQAAKGGLMGLIQGLLGQ